MSRTFADQNELNEQRKMLNMGLGIPGSGAARYSAAMYFYQQGKISIDLLEIYRRCSKFDHDDPIRLARQEGVIPK